NGPVRRRPLPELVFEERWDEPAKWAVDPPGTEHTRAGPPARGNTGPPARGNAGQPARGSDRETT
ncbi:MAG: hypothetical protein ACXW2C_11650, partial [Acidimicrobiia bacterium]